MEINKLQKDIEKFRAKLTKKAKRSGIYENFGQKEVNALEDKYIDISSYTNEMNDIRRLINQFNEWCMICDIKKIRR